MAALVCGLTIVGIGFLAHVVWWRICLPRRQTRALLVIFLGTAALVLGVLWFGGAMIPGVSLPETLPDYCQTVLLVLAFTAAYVITYSAVEADSPTLVLVRIIAAAGPEGLPEDELRSQASDDVLVKPRIADLVRDHMLRLEKDQYRITTKGRRFVGIFIFYRRLLGAGKGG